MDRLDCRIIGLGGRTCYYSIIAVLDNCSIGIPMADLPVYLFHCEHNASLTSSFLFSQFLVSHVMLFIHVMVLVSHVSFIHAHIIPVKFLLLLQLHYNPLHS